jgi:ubiquinone/menaquinone biosynthesis C-methylase UbiE
MDLHLNAERFTGKDYTLLYDHYRPEPPADLLEQAVRYRDTFMPALLVDLGCGTGLSTFAWQDKVRKIIGFEPSEDMLDIAREKSNDSNQIHFLQAFAHELPLEDETVDIACCAQSFHWMEPEATLMEVNRVLKPGGVFMVYDCSWPPTFNWALENAYRTLFDQVNTITQSHDETFALYWDKQKHLHHIEQSNYFRFVKEAFFHKIENGGKSQFLGIALSQGGLQALLKRGHSEEEIGLTHFKTVLEEAVSLDSAPLTFHYKAIYAVK